MDCSLKAQQQAKAILRHFNVRVTPADIFSRCQVGAAGPRLGEGPLRMERWACTVDSAAPLPVGSLY